jgi:CheY-like chemotaxis protein
MKNAAETIKIRKKARVEQETKTDDNTLDSVISEVLKDLTEECVNDQENLHITSEDVCRFIKKLNEKAAKMKDDDSKRDSPPSELKLFSQIEHYYRFHLQNRKYQSFRVEFETQNKEDNKAALEGKFHDLIDFANNPTRDKADKADAFNLCSVLIQHVYQILNPESDSAQNLQHGECSRETEGDYRRANYVPLNDYHKSELLTWNRLLQEDGEYNHGVYPYCKFQELDDHTRIILLIVTKLDENYIDDKVKKVDKIEPVHLVILKSRDLFRFGKSHLGAVEFKLRHAIGNLSYAIFTGRTNESLASMSTEAALVARHWNSTGIDRLFEESENEEKATGITLSNKIIEEMLCADVEGLKTLEVFPFDRAFLFSGSNFRAIDENPRTKTRAGSSMKLTVLEAALKSLRPQDNDRFLSTMERLEKKEEHAEQPSLGMFFDVTQKTIGYKTECLIDAGVKWKLRTLDNSQSTEFEPIIKSLEEETLELKENKDKIEAVFKTLFSGFTEKKDDLLQAFCQKTYQYYDPDGLCLISDFAVDIAGIEGLKTIQDAYFDVFFEREMADWKRVWAETSQNIPDLKAFKKWLEKRESKVVFVSFDPFQNLGNMDKEGKRYLKENDAFTIILVADEDIGKNKFDLDTEIKDLKQMFLMIIRRKLREEKMKKEVIRGQKKLFNSMMSGTMHRLKSYAREQSEKAEIESMLGRFQNVFEAEDVLAEPREFKSTQKVYTYFLEPFIQEQLGEKLTGIEIQMIKQQFDKACREYLSKWKNLKKKETIEIKDLDIKFNENYFPEIVIEVQDDFVKEAVKISINNALEHAAIYSEKTQNKAEVIISFNFSSKMEKGLYFFELSIINSSNPLSPEQLTILNSPEPQISPKDASKTTSTGIGRYIARLQLQKSIGKGADISLDNVGENLVEAKLILPARRSKRSHEDKKYEKDEGIEISTKHEYKNFDYILYIEDNKESRENSKNALVKLLGDERKLFDCDNKQEALVVIEKALPSIVLLDLNILRKPNDTVAIEDYAYELIEEIAEKKEKTPIIVLSNNAAKDIERSLNERSLKDYSTEIKDFDKDVEIEEKTIVIPLQDIKKLSEEEGKGLLKALGKWVKENMELESGSAQKTQRGPKMVETNVLQFLKVNFNDQDFDEKLEKYRKDNISDDIPNKIFIATAEANSEDTLFKTVSQWFSYNLESFFKDEQGKSRFSPIIRNARFRTIFLNIQIDDKLNEIADVKFKYWCLPHNILISKPGIEIDSTLAWKWKFTAHGTRGSLSTLRHDIKNMISVDEGNEIITKINAVEQQLLFMDENLDSDLSKAFKSKDKKIIKTLKDRPDKANPNIKDLFEELHGVFSRQKFPEKIQAFKVTIENLQEFLEK